MMEIVPAETCQQEFLELVKEYTDTILQQGEEVRKCLSSQHLSAELRDMYKKYGPPNGSMYVAMVDGRSAGCVALTGDGGEYCEIKRLYVRPGFRGQHLSSALTRQVIADARQIGYRYIRLDTFPFMDKAIRLYEALGFAYIGRYNDNPAENAIFMQLKL